LKEKNRRSKNLLKHGGGRSNLQVTLKRGAGGKKRGGENGERSEYVVRKRWFRALMAGGGNSKRVSSYLGPQGTSPGKGRGSRRNSRLGRVNLEGEEYIGGGRETLEKKKNRKGSPSLRAGAKKTRGQSCHTNWKIWER